MVQEEKTSSSTSTGESTAGQSDSPVDQPRPPAAAAAASEPRGATAKSQPEAIFSKTGGPSPAAFKVRLKILDRNRPRSDIRAEEREGIVNYPDPQQSPMASNAPVPESSSFDNRKPRIWRFICQRLKTASKQLRRGIIWYSTLIPLAVISNVFCALFDTNYFDAFYGFSITTYFCTFFSLIVTRAGLLNEDMWIEKTGPTEPIFKKSQYVRPKEQDTTFSQEVVDVDEIPYRRHSIFSRQSVVDVDEIPSRSNSIFSRKSDSLESSKSSIYTQESPFAVLAEVHAQQQTPPPYSSEGACGYSPTPSMYED